MNTEAISMCLWPEGITNVHGPYIKTFQGKQYMFYLGTVRFDAMIATEGRQRRLTKGWVNRLTKAFDPLSVRVTVAVEPDGSVLNIGGQHCQEAAKMHGFTEWECYIVRSSGPAETARLMRQDNDKKSDLHVIGLVQRIKEGKDTLALDMDNVVRSHGYRFAQGDSPYTFCSTATIEKAVKRSGVSTFDRALYLLKRTWGGHPGSTKACLVCALVHLLENYTMPSGEFPCLDTLSTTLKQLEVSLLTAASRKGPESVDPTNDIKKGIPRVADAMAISYNNSLKTKAKHDRKLIRKTSTSPTHAND